jgi:polyhydroxyalkanoate depolymerase
MRNMHANRGARLTGPRQIMKWTLWHAYCVHLGKITFFGSAMNLFSYPTYQAVADMMRPLRALADFSRVSLNAWPELAASPYGRNTQAACEWLALAGLSHRRPAFGIESLTDTAHGPVAVTEEIAYQTPFCSLLHFKKSLEVEQPRVLMIAPMSGHFATLLRGTVRTMLADHDVYITDWHNPRDISLEHGRFGFDEYVAHVTACIEAIGPGAHVMAICQPTVAALAAVSLMAAHDHPAQPGSMTLMAGPLDTRVNPSSVNHLAKSKPIEWFEQKLISAVPMGFAGAHRRVYPGFVQLAAFMAMNAERHRESLGDMVRERAKGDPEKAKAVRLFYEEYFATMDLTAEFYLETVVTIFQKHALPLGELTVFGERVDPSLIRRTALLTVEGEKDDICPVGQTLAAQDMCSRLRPYMKTHHVQTGVGHYGVFNGRRWENQIYPRVRAMIHENDASAVPAQVRSRPASGLHEYLLATR